MSPTSYQTAPPRDPDYHAAERPENQVDPTTVSVVQCTQNLTSSPQADIGLLLPSCSALGRRGGRAGRGRGRRAGRGGVLEHLGEGSQLLAGRGEVALALGLLVALQMLQ